MTKYGISARAYPDLDIETLTRFEAAEIYRRDYWERPGFDSIAEPKIACKVFDLGVNCGVGRAARFLQEAANLVEIHQPPLAVDGVCGPKTCDRVNRYRHSAAILAALRVIAGQHYISLNRPKYIAGWLMRLMED